MLDIFLPCAGSSSRFPGVRPKWMLTHPNGLPLFARALSGLHFSRRSWVHMAVLEEHLKEHGVTERQIRQCLPRGLKLNLIPFAERTSSQAATVARMVKKVHPAGGIFIKDCDNYFSHAPRSENAVCTLSAREARLAGDLPAKCFVTFDSQRRITNIVEKRIVSEDFCVGGYGFASAATFLSEFMRIRKQDSEVFISHVIYEAMLRGYVFHARAVGGYEDYGSAAQWRRLVADYSTLFIDLDGTILTNTGRIGGKVWGTGKLLTKTSEQLRRLAYTGRHHIVLTTARPESMRRKTEAELRAAGIPFNQLVMGLPHTARILVNDNPANGSMPWPMAQAVNVIRDSDELGAILSQFSPA